MFVGAPWYSLAIWLASVSPGLKSERWSGDAVADHLRDRDRLAERAAEPEDDRRDDRRPDVRERRHRRTISQRVAPSAERAFLEVRGTVRKSSRQIAEVIGRIMIVSTRSR